MAPQKLLPPHVPFKNMRRFMDDLFRADPLLDELFTPNPILDRIHLADGENFADEIAHSPFACLDVECRREPCVAFQERVLAAQGFTACPTCHCTVSNLARLDCSLCAA